MRKPPPADRTDVLDLLPGGLKPLTILLILAACNTPTEVWWADLLEDAADRDPDIIVHEIIATERLSSRF